MGGMVIPEPAEGDHGRGRKKAPVDARIARLAIHAASTVSLFYIETWNRMKSGGANG